ncbi:hypothetical protein M8C21_014220 [Ambrosia artemisiifolia]|uniref:Protein kinase domain-containing protein n=1 Tax=Ambrosia artemisiifolia TaxID=4212 RepID=A0AAD5CK33_AMBAR|nr:hypothetical protein M8C21_014220 [Ambrosia artemisiifolia]
MFHLSFILLSLTLCLVPYLCNGNAEVSVLMDIKASLDPENKHLMSWTESGDPCSNSFVGVVCNEYLKIPKEISALTELSELYLNVNNLTGDIPLEIGNMTSLQVVELCCNELNGSIPSELGNLKKLNVLALQHNRLTGQIPRTIGRLDMLERLDLSFNRLTGPIPINIARVSKLEFFDVQNNTLSGFVPTGLKKLGDGFGYKNNRDLCGTTFPSLRPCTDLDVAMINQLEPFPPAPNTTIPQNIPQSASIMPHCHETRCSNSSNLKRVGIIAAIVTVIAALTVTALVTIFVHRRRKQKIWSKSETPDHRFSIPDSSLKSSEYSCAWDPTQKSPKTCGFCVELEPKSDSLQSFNLEEIESATHRSSHVLDWPKRVSIINGIAKGLAYLHRDDAEKPGMIHRNISVEKILIDEQYNPLITDAGLLKLLADDIVYSALKVSAALGYMAPEYITTGKFTEKSDVYAFGVVVLQILSGQSNLTGSIRAAAADRRLDDFIDKNLEGKFSESEADKLTRIGLICIDEVPENRLTMEDVIREISKSV